MADQKVGENVVEPQPVPEKKPRSDFYGARQMFQNFGVKIRKRQIIITDETGTDRILIGFDKDGF